MKSEKPETPETVRGKILIGIRSILSSIMAILFLFSLSATVLAVVLSLVVTTAVLVITLGATVLLLAIPTLLAFLIGMSVSPVKYQFDPDDFNLE